VLNKVIRNSASLPIAFSVYLDIVRLFASLLVVFYHSNNRLISPQHPPLSAFGHEAVVVFFVLSGYVIAFVTANRERNAASYFSSRISRIYSVVIPVIALTFVLDFFGQSINPDLYKTNTTHDYALVRLISSTLFLNETWFLSLMMFSNVPYWSLCYEVWYYVLFGLACFAPRNYRVGLLCLGFLLLGPKLLLLAPLWFAGVFAYRFTSQKNLSLVAGIALVLISIIGFWVYNQFDFREATLAYLNRLTDTNLHKKLVFAKFFLTDYFLTIIVVAHFVGMYAILKHLFPDSYGLSRVAKFASWIALLTFPLYLAHQPLLWFFTALFGPTPSQNLWAAVVIATIASAALLTPVCELLRKRIKKLLSPRLTSLMARFGT
jgi:peptidoglycan/LPS O-acetylase OafA/YrhL